MIELFKNLVGDVAAMNSDLVLVLASVFGLLLLTEFCRFFELLIDFVFRRKK